MANSPLKNIQPEQQHNSDMKAIVNPSSPTIANTLVSRSTFYQGDCLVEMDKIADKSVDMILCDLPYGTLKDKRTAANIWDSIINLEQLWTQYKRIIKNNKAIVLTASQPFSTDLVSSNKKLFKYEWIWDKKIPSGMSYARFQPMRQHETILVFGCGPIDYNPQMTKRITPIKSGGLKLSDSGGLKHEKYKPLNKTYEYKNPTTILSFDKVRKNSVHPTQKPVELMEYLIKTYTNEGDTVLDNCMGSGTTGVACKKTGRHFIGIEKDEKYFEIAVSRVSAYCG